ARTRRRPREPTRCSGERPATAGAAAGDTHRAGCVPPALPPAAEEFLAPAETRLRPFFGVKEAWMAARDKGSEASTKVQEVAANIQQAAATRKRISGSKA